MIVRVEPGCRVRDKAAVVRAIENAGCRAQVSETVDGTWIGVIGRGTGPLVEELQGLPGVAEVRPSADPYALVSRERRPERSVVKVGERGVAIGRAPLVVAAGPCAVESEARLAGIAEAVARDGATILRGGAFKPRSSPYSFQGHGELALRWLEDVGRRHGLPVVTEVLSPDDVDLVARHADMLQIGARNMQNFRLLSAVGEQPKPVLLKRGMMATVEELLLAAEYVHAAGNPAIVLCERGIRTFETSTRNTLDISAVPVLKERTHLPVIVDPSHAAGRREIVPALAAAAVAAGADGLIVEVHTTPDEALSDGRQSLTPDGFSGMMRTLAGLVAAR